MTGWEFAKYLVDMMYSHWATTIAFMFFSGFIKPLAGIINIGFSKKKKRKRKKSELQSNPR